MQKDNLLVWIDLEMTGLDWQHDTILEAALIITDENLKIIYPGIELVIHQPDSILESMNEWSKIQHGKSGLTQKVKDSSLSLADAEKIIVDVIQEYCTPQSPVLCGNTIWQDRGFLKYHMPLVNAFLHYRMIDVSAVKELVKRWFKSDPNAIFIKTDTHRALIDIQESIAELAHYKKYFFIQKIPLN
jgi:oligoribonuclease